MGNSSSTGGSDEDSNGVFALWVVFIGFFCMALYCCKMCWCRYVSPECQEASERITTAVENRRARTYYVVYAGTRPSQLLRPCGAAKKYSLRPPGVDHIELPTGILDCSVCLNEIAVGEKGRILPKCGHYFHADCVDIWFRSQKTCPLCRAGVSRRLVSFRGTIPAPARCESTTAIDTLSSIPTQAQNDAQSSSDQTDTLPSGTGPSQSNTGKARTEPSSEQPEVDLESGGNGSGPRTLGNDRRLQEDGSSAVQPSIPDHHVEDVSDVHLEV